MYGVDCENNIATFIPLDKAHGQINPILNGQTQTISTAVSGRVTAIEIDPTDPNSVYVGTAQGGIFRSLNGGSTWTPIFDSAPTLAIGSLTLRSAPGHTFHLKQTPRKFLRLHGGVTEATTLRPSRKRQERRIAAALHSGGHGTAEIRIKVNAKRGRGET